MTFPAIMFYLDSMYLGDAPAPRPAKPKRLAPKPAQVIFASLTLFKKDLNWEWRCRDCDMVPTSLCEEDDDSSVVSW